MVSIISKLQIFAILTTFMGKILACLSDDKITKEEWIKLATWLVNEVGKIFGIKYQIVEVPDLQKQPDIHSAR